MVFYPGWGETLGRRIAVERTWTGLSGGRRGLQKALTAINAAHSAFHDLETVETLLAQAVSELLGAQQVILYVFEDTSSDLVLRKTMGRLGEWRSVTSLRLERGLAAESARLKIPFFVPRVSEDTRYDPSVMGAKRWGHGHDCFSGHRRSTCSRSYCRYPFARADDFR